MRAKCSIVLDYHYAEVNCRLLYYDRPSMITSHSQKLLSMFRRTIGTALAAADKLSFPGGRSVFMISQ